MNCTLFLDQLNRFAQNHEDLLKTLHQKEQQMVTLQNEVQQYKGALSYSLQIQEQLKATIEQAAAAEAAAKMSAATAAANPTT